MQERDVLLTPNEVAELESTNYQTIKKRIQRGTLKAIKIDVDNRQGFEHRINLLDISKKGQTRYYMRLKAKAAEQLSLDDYPWQTQNYKELTLLDLTAQQREEAAFWEKTVKDWQRFIADSHKMKTEKTKEFISIFNDNYPNSQISERTLRRKWELYRKYGVVALSDDRRQGNHRGTTISDKIYAVFMQWWLDENKPTVTQTRRLVIEWAKRHAPELLPIPSLTAFYTATKQLPLPVTKYYRDGEKVFSDECLPFVRRVYENFDSNDIWSPDYHTLDFSVKDDVTGEVFRPHLIPWIDIRSRKVLSVYLTKSANSDGTIISFRKAVERHGIPFSIYTDNGREFLVSDFGGRGNRKTDGSANYGATILERLGVEMHNANVRNAKAKVIERLFRNVTFDLSKLIKTYCGGKPEQKPHRLNNVLKKEENIPLLSEAQEMLETYFEGWYNEQKSTAEGLHGASPNECYYENLHHIRKATKEDLDLMLLRSTRTQKVKRNGVSIKIGETDVWFSSHELVEDYLGRSVFVRYDPENMKQVHVYDDKERFIGYAMLSDQGGYNFGSGADIEVMKETNRNKNKLKESVTGFKKNLAETAEAPPAIDVLMEAAQSNIENADHKSEVKLIGWVRYDQEQASPFAGYETDEKIDWAKALTNLKRQKEAERVVEENLEPDGTAALINLKHSKAVGAEEPCIDIKKMISNVQARKGENSGL